MSHWIAVSLSLVLVGGVARADAVKGRPAPRIDLPTLEGSRIRLDALKGKVVVIDFWASWCGPCREELPELEKLKASYEARGVAFITVNIDIDRANADAMAKKLRITMPVALDPKGDRVANEYGLPTMPTSYVVDQEGVLRFIHDGFRGAGDVSKLKREIDDLLAR